MIGLRFTDGLSTVDVSNGSTGWLTEYVPGGNKSLSITKATNQVSETAGAVLVGGASNNRATVQALGRLFEQARRFAAERIGPRVWVEMRVEDADTWWRSEVVDGQVQLTEELLLGKLTVRITWTRYNWWEGAVATAYSGTIWNHHDGGHNGIVAIAGSAVTGDLPSPAKIRIERADSTTTWESNSDFYIAHNVNMNPGSYSHVIEGENRSAGSNNVAGAQYSNGYAQLLKGASAVTWFDLPAALIAAAGGGPVRLLAAIGNFSNYQAQATLRTAGLWSVWDSGWKDVSGAVFDFGGLRLPPYGWNPEQTVNSETIQLRLQFRSASAGASIPLDAVYLLPADGLRILRTPGLNSNAGTAIVDDSAENAAYLDWYGQRVGHVSREGNAIELTPGKDQRLYIMDVSGKITRQWAVTVTYRPRRLTV